MIGCDLQDLRTYTKKNASHINERRFYNAVVSLFKHFPVLIVKVIFHVRVSVSW
jgi:hypothetical protein